MRNPVYKAIACVTIVSMLGIFSPSAGAFIPSTLVSIPSLADGTSGKTTEPGFEAVAEPSLSPDSEPAPASEPEPSPATESAPNPTTAPDLSAKAVLTAVGDIIPHQAVISGGLQKDKSYSYDYLFNDISMYFKQSDCAIANYEGTLNGPPYSGYPMFGAPDAIATAMKTAGIDLVTTANNHAFDRKLPGLVRTPKIFRQAGIDVVGTRSDAKEPLFEVMDVNGIKIGITAYTWETIGTKTGRSLNGMNMPVEANPLIDSFNPYRPERFKQDMAAMKTRIQAMREADAECLVFLMHWGDEYKTVSNQTQRKLAQYLADQGVDIIIGHHPHVLQEISVLSSAVSGKNTLVYYSLGNFLANMHYTTKGTKGNAEDAVMARVEIHRDSTGKISVTKGEYLETYVWKSNVGGKTIHRIIPIRAAILVPNQFGIGKQVILLENSTNRIAKILGKSNGLKNGILIGEWIGEPNQ